MKKIIIPFVLFCFSFISYSQVENKTSNFITLNVSSKIKIEPDFYRIQFCIQEEEQRVNYTVIGKTPIDTIRNLFFSALGKYNLSQKDLVKGFTSSVEVSSNIPRIFSQFEIYSCKVKSRDLAIKILNEFRIQGLRGISIAYGCEPKTFQMLADSLYTKCVAESKDKAILVASKFGKSVGLVHNIEQVSSSFDSYYGNNGENLEYPDRYSQNSLLNKFEMDFKEKFAICSIKVTYELK